MGVVNARASRGVVGRLTIGVAAALIVAGTPSRAMAEEPYPNRPIHLVVPYSTGNTIDFAARLLARSISEHVGQPVIVENKVGSSGNIGADYVAKAAPDGYTVLFTGTQITSLPTLMPSIAVDPLTSRVPITRLAEQPFLIVANPSLGVATLPELIARARAEPGRIAYSTSGIGATTHLAAALIFQRRRRAHRGRIPARNQSQAGRRGPSGSDIGVDHALALHAALHATPIPTRARLDDGEEHLSVHFPQEWLRDPHSHWLTGYLVDMPWDDPELLEALVALHREL